MVVRYFNLKQGSEKVFGHVIKVNVSAKGIEKLTELNGDFSSTSSSFKLFKEEDGCEIYTMLIPNEKIVNATGIPTPVRNGEPASINLKFSREGEISLYGTDKIGVYIHEISGKEANEMRSAAGRWALQRAWVCG